MSSNEALENYYAQLDQNPNPWEVVECRTSDPELWWVDNTESITEDKDKLALALTICNRCPMREPCRDRGLGDDDILWGIWGGLMPGERLIYLGKVKQYNHQRLINKARLVRRVTQVPQPTPIGE